MILIDQHKWKCDHPPQGSEEFTHFDSVGSGRLRVWMVYRWHDQTLLHRRFWQGSLSAVIGSSGLRQASA